MCVYVSWKHGISLCPGSDCQRECCGSLMDKDNIVLCVCLCVFCVPPPYLHTLDADSPLFVQYIHWGSYYGSCLNSSLSTSSDLLSLPFLLSLSPGVSLPLLFLFSSFFSFLFYVALFSPCSPHFLISILGCNHPLLVGGLFINTVYRQPHTGSYCVCVFPSKGINAWIFMIADYKAAQFKKRMNT